MRPARWSLVAIAAALIGVVAGYGWARRGAQAPVPGAASSTLMAMEPTRTPRTVLYYQDPMRPGVKFDKPGKSPYMDMDLVPVFADDGADAGGIAVSASARQSLGIRIGHVESAAIAPRATAVGSVTYDEHEIALVQARVGGYVTHLHVRAVLDRVHRSQALVDITSPAWIEAEGEYLALLRSDSPSNASLQEATRQRLVVLGIPEDAILGLERTRSVPPSTTLLAPIDGVVTELGLREGATFEPGALLFRLNGTATVWVNAQLPESVARMVKPGSIAETRATARPGAVFKGRVESILPQIDPVTRTLGVRVAIDNSAGQLSPGMFVQTTLTGAAREPHLWVSSEAVIATGERSVVIRVRDDGRFDAGRRGLGQDGDPRRTRRGPGHRALGAVSDRLGSEPQIHD